MRCDWQQLSPGEREVLLRHVLLKKKDAAVTAQGVCAVMKKTHSLWCYTDKSGKATIQFVTARKGVRSGSSIADDLAEGIYKAALRARGIEVEDGLGKVAFRPPARVAVRASH